MTTGCPDRLGDLGAYALGGLDAHESSALERHLAGCAGCRRELADLAPLPGLLALAETAPPPAPSDLRHRTLAGLPPTPRRRRLPVAAALVLVAVLGAGTIVALDEPDRPSMVLMLPSGDDARVQGEAGLRQAPSGVQMELTLAGLQPAASGYYHAWLTRGDLRVSAGTFVGGPDGQAVARLQCGGNLADYDDLVVTWHGRDRADEVVALRQPLPA